MRLGTELKPGTPRYVVAGVSMTDLAKRVDLSLSTISRYFSGQRVPNALIFLQIADSLDMNPYHLASRMFKHDD